MEDCTIKTLCKRYIACQFGEVWPPVATDNESKKSAATMGVKTLSYFHKLAVHGAYLG